MRYELLGRLRVVDRGTATYVTARKLEVLLATLVGRAGQVVTTDQLIDELWGEHPPQRVNAALHVYISQLRKFLDRDDRDENPIVTRPPGYLLHLGDDELDVHDYQRLLARGRTAAGVGHYHEAVDHLEAALGLWRDGPLADIRDSPLIARYVTWLEETWLEANELLNEACLSLRRHREVVGRLYTLVADQPLRESFYRQLMLALYRSERQADALMVYQRARARLTEELGIEPCRSLRELHHAILRGDPMLEARAS